MQAQVAVGGVYKKRVGLDVAAAIRSAGAVPTAGAAAVLNVAISDLRRAAAVMDARVVGGSVAPQDDVDQRRVAFPVVHPAAIVSRVRTESDIS